MDDTPRILELKRRYVHLVDAKRWSELDRCLAPDFAFAGQFAMRGASEFVHRVKTDLAGAVTVHELGTPVIRIDSPDSGQGRWPFSDLIDERQEGTGILRRGRGVYHERYVRFDHRWLIAAMRITRERVECEVHSDGAVVRSQTCVAQQEVVDWLRRERGA
jgi:hypothetical protein